MPIEFTNAVSLCIKILILSEASFIVRAILFSVVQAIVFSCQATRLGFTAIFKLLLTVNVTTLPIIDPLIISLAEWSL
jgi:hypothetical protein